MRDARNCSRTDVPEGEPRHHLGRGGGGTVGGTFESHAVSKTCLAIVDMIDAIPTMAPMPLIDFLWGLLIPFSTVDCAFTYCAGISRTSWPTSRRRRLHKKSIFCTKSPPLVELYAQSPERPNRGSAGRSQPCGQGRVLINRVAGVRRV